MYLVFIADFYVMIIVFLKGFLNFLSKNKKKPLISESNKIKTECKHKFSVDEWDSRENYVIKCYIIKKC